MRKVGFRDGWLALKLYELRRETELRKARDMVGTHLFGKGWEEVRPILDPAHEEHAHLKQVIYFWELAASLVKHGVLHPEMYLDCCEEGLYTYAVLETHLPRIREMNPGFLANTESMLREHPHIKGRLMELRTRLFRGR
jgi:hypothetical protein